MPLPQRSISVKVSATEMRPFRRLVDFLIEVEDYARVTADDALGEMVRQVRTDLGLIRSEDDE